MLYRKPYSAIAAALFLAFAFSLSSARAAEPAGPDDPAVQLPDTLKNVRAGQWARYRINTMFGTAEQKQTVTAVSGTGDEQLITILTEMSLDDETVDSREETYTYKKLRDDQIQALSETQQPVLSRSETELAGRTVSAVGISYIQDGQTFRLWLSETVPLAGVIRLELEGMDQPVVELIDFGE